MDDDRFRAEWDRQFERSVRAAAQRTYEQVAWQPAHLVYGMLADELRRRGIDPDPAAVYDAAQLISRGKRPAVLQRPQQ